jgi:phenylpropionate dioxygenase-like ring-hydroxylating dioxygenase large terminal subunit
LFVKPTPLLRRQDLSLTQADGRVVTDVYEDVDTSDIPLVPELEEDTCISMDIMRDFPYDVSLLLENLLDVGHVHFTHHGTISRRDRAPEVLLEVRLGSMRIWCWKALCF